MRQSIKTKLIRTGNSRAIIIPKKVIERLHLAEGIELVVTEDHLVVRQSRKPREGWTAAFQQMAERGNDTLLDKSVSSEWDEEEWDW